MNKDDRSIYAKLIIELLETECSVIGLYDYEEYVEYYHKQTGENTWDTSIKPIDGYEKHSRLFILENAVQRELNVMSDALILT